MNSAPLLLENGLNLQEVVTTGSVLQINQDYGDDGDNDFTSDTHKPDVVNADIGQPVQDFTSIEKLTSVDDEGNVKKKILEEGGGLPLHEGCTVFIAFSGYWENELMPFDSVPLYKPMEVDLKENGLLPGLDQAIKSMLVGETALFLLSYKIMYGELGIPPRIKPKADCVFYIKLIKSILTPKDGKINFSEPNMFQRVRAEVNKYITSGSILHQSCNYPAAIQLFKKSVSMLHRCRLADEAEEQIQEKLLRKLYLNLAVCYNKLNKPLLTCIACNELNRLKKLWNCPKALFQNAKALRMIGDYTQAEKKLKKVMQLSPGKEEIKAEYDLLMRTKNASVQAKINTENSIQLGVPLISEDFKRQVDAIIATFKENDSDQLTLPSNLNTEELEYLKQACINANLFYSREQDEGNKKSEECPVLDYE